MFWWIEDGDQGGHGPDKGWKAIERSKRRSLCVFFSPKRSVFINLAVKSVNISNLYFFKILHFHCQKY